ncbi:MAG: hypothetical protein SangKO_049500 [Sandaracinaceae bacterium]
MEIRVRFVGVAPSDTRAVISEVERRVDLALDRLSPRIREVSVTCSDVNGPRGGLDQQCVVIITLKNEGDPVVGRALEETRGQAVARSLKRARRRLEDSFERQRVWTSTRRLTMQPQLQESS